MRRNATAIKFGIFGLVMVVFTAFLFMIFGEYRGGSTESYSALFTDASRLKTGDSVRVAGIRVGTVQGVSLQEDHSVRVEFDADKSVVLTTGTKAAVRYLNLVGDRYLELIDGPGSTRKLPAEAQIPKERTEPALDLDLLLGGLKPVIRGLNPRDVNALTASLLQVLQGQSGTLQSLLSNTSSFSTTLADNNQVIQQVIDNLNTTLQTLGDQGQQFSGAIQRLDQLVSGLAADRDPIGAAITSLDNGTASLADLLTDARPPLAGTVDELNRLAPLLDRDEERIGAALQKAPTNYKKLQRLGAYGSWIMYYICGLKVRVTDLQGRTAVFPEIRQDTGRCAEP
ncbi:MCE family protein [Mycobacterium sp. MYCO198283]|uniref:MCE family protein n=1 Tax=Mycobacterium sp. MYCO198283 TaxID=2883505 RepID=UPI001E503B94|nr:MCE family protein [Mycobacterium sp. MYCO198283]MCG5434175.1 MCE family protein [Mycobacterium sp. MYCO198283]